MRKLRPRISPANSRAGVRPQPGGSKPMFLRHYSASLYTVATVCWVPLKAPCPYFPQPLMTVLHSDSHQGLGRGEHSTVWGGREEKQGDLEPGRAPGGHRKSTWVWAGGKYEEERGWPGGLLRSPPSSCADWPGFPCLPSEMNPPFMLFKYLQVEGGWSEGGWGIFLNGCRVRPEVQGQLLQA